MRFYGPSTLPLCNSALQMRFYIHLILIIHRFRICWFPWLLEFICNPQVNICCSSAVIHGHAQSGENVTHSKHTILAEVKQGCTLPSCSNSHTKNRWFFMVYLVPRFSYFCWIAIFKMIPSIVLPGYLVLLSTKDCDVPHRQKSCVIR